MDLNALRDYGKWIGQSPYDVLQSVKAVGGWQRVFPGSMPIWASKIRQYFNYVPSSLRLLNDDESGRINAIAKKFINAAAAKLYLDIKPWNPGQAEGRAKEAIGTLKALSGQVYFDVGNSDIWFQMGTGATVYHWPIIPNDPEKAAIAAQLWHGQEEMPVFKLVSPDAVGGSREIVIKNNGRKTIGAVHEEFEVYSRLVRDSVRQGSYNYAETFLMGLAEHQRLDVRTDPMQDGYFVEPPNVFGHGSLMMNKFPPNDRFGKPLADQQGDAPGNGQ